MKGKVSSIKNKKSGQLKQDRMIWVTSWTPHSKHLFSSTGSGVWQYLQTGHLETEDKLIYCHMRCSGLFCEKQEYT